MEPQDTIAMSANLLNLTQNRKAIDTEIDLDAIVEIFPAVQGNERALLGKTVATVGGAQRLASATTSFPSAAARDRITAVLGALLAGNVVKKASEFAFMKEGRSMTAPNVIAALGNAFNTLTEETSNKK